MNKPLTLALLTIFMLASFTTTRAPAQIGQRIDRALDRIGTEVREGWEEARGSVNRMGLRARVYSRLHWDKDLQGSTIDIDVQGAESVLLRGSVANEAAKRKAIELARDTVGVTTVLDELAIAPPAQSIEGREAPSR
jgi:hyperosmotically inducible periplasmic protein